jgi:hypothetical protein
MKRQTSSSVLYDCSRDRRADFTVFGRPWYKLSLELGGSERGRETCIGTHDSFEYVIHLYKRSIINSRLSLTMYAQRMHNSVGTSTLLLRDREIVHKHSG